MGAEKKNRLFKDYLKNKEIIVYGKIKGAYFARNSISSKEFKENFGH